MQYLFGNLIAIVVSIAIAAVIGALLRRALDGQPARWRSFVLALIAMVVVAEIAGPVAVQLGITAGTTPSTQSVLWWLFIMLLVILGVGVAALGVLVMGEAVLPTGRYGTFADIARSLAGGARRSVRYVSLLRVTAASRLWRSARGGPDSPEFAAAITRTLSDAGPTFVKIGQVLSTRPELVSPALAASLTTLQSDAPALPADIVEAELTRAWGRSPDALLAELDRTPFAAASLAQVHAGRMPDGTEVVVKVRRPGAVQQVSVDTSILRRFAVSAEQRFGWARDLGAVALAEGLGRSLLGELDYRSEARNARACSAGLVGDPLITAPEVITDLTRENVLVMERFHGVKLADAAATLTAERRAELADALLSRVATSIFVDGVFHADLHPGNLLLREDGRIGMLDFGAIGVIDPETRRQLSLLLLALLTGDDLAAATALTLAFDLGDRRQRGSTDAMRRELGRLMTLHLAGSPDFTALVADLVRFLSRHGIAVPGDVAGAFRTLASLQGTLRALVPGFDEIAAMRGILPTLIHRSLEPIQLAQHAAIEAALALSIARRLPERIERVSDDLASGRLVVRTRAFADADDRRFASALVTDAVSGVLAAVLIGVGAGLFTVADGPQIGPGIGLLPLVGAVVGTAGTALAFRLLVRLFRRRPGS
ncbi:ABC1 kinase family protein [Microbacterium nymphoidis]|uniref:ABC1 kinase family protein n=1 Tax=Microbacterium nymphoidis TaxID=2898586 RepID=UPI001E4EB64A|nr:AarF/UbiB family protein [Microbacterium nymphoidis]MCD2500099.1 AarF/UbiB family protein [Microbacterium nymphoidis]